MVPVIKGVFILSHYAELDIDAVVFQRIVLGSICNVKNIEIRIQDLHVVFIHAQDLFVFVHKNKQIVMWKLLQKMVGKEKTIDVGLENYLSACRFPILFRYRDIIPA